MNLYVGSPLQYYTRLQGRATFSTGCPGQDAPDTSFDGVRQTSTLTVLLSAIQLVDGQSSSNLSDSSAWLESSHSLLMNDVLELYNKYISVIGGIFGGMSGLQVSILW